MTRLPVVTVLAALATLSCAHHGRVSASRNSKLPPPQPVFERQIRNAIDAGEGDPRLRALREKMAAQPDNLEVRLALARAYKEAGLPEVAAEHYRLAAGRFPDSVEVQVALAKTLRDLNLRQEAALTLDRFLAGHAAKSVQPVSWLGIIRDEMGQWTEGEKAHRGALALDPKSDFLHNNLGYNLLIQQRHDEAAREFEEALRLNPKSVPARNNLALALANKGDLALREWQKVNDPASAHNNLAAVLIEQGRYTDARGQLDIALGYNRRHPAALANLKLVSELDGRPAEVHLEPPVTTRWERWRSMIVSWFTGPLPGQERTAAPPASASNGRGL